MKKVVLCVILVLCLSGMVLAEKQIQDILITGQTRTNETVIIQLLPFAEGEIYRESDLALVLKRLLDLGIFHPKGYEVKSEEIDDNSVRITIQVIDPYLLYPDLISYALDKAFKIVFEQTLDQIIYNPLGNGMNVFGGISWGKFAYVNLGFSGPITAGWNYTTKYYLFKDTLAFTDSQDYRAQGHQVIFETKNYLTANWKQVFDLQYYTAEARLNHSDTTQQYLIVKTKSRFASLQSLLNQLHFNTTYLFSLNDNPSSWKVDFAYTREQQVLKSSKILVSLKGGISSQETPLNFQYNGGGFTPLPLRGTESLIRGFNYGIINLEWHQSIGYGLRVVGFVDAGNFWDTKVEKIEKNIGIGLAYDSPLGLPLRVDVARSLNDGSLQWHVGLDLLFRSEN